MTPIIEHSLSIEVLALKVLQIACLGVTHYVPPHHFLLRCTRKRKSRILSMATFRFKTISRSVKTV